MLQTWSFVLFKIPKVSYFDTDNVSISYISSKDVLATVLYPYQLQSPTKKTIKTGFLLNFIEIQEGAVATYLIYQRVPA